MVVVSSILREYTTSPSLPFIPLPTHHYSRRPESALLLGSARLLMATVKTTPPTFRTSATHQRSPPTCHLVFPFLRCAHGIHFYCFGSFGSFVLQLPYASLFAGVISPLISPEDPGQGVLLLVRVAQSPGPRSTVGTSHRYPTLPASPQPTLSPSIFLNVVNAVASPARMILPGSLVSDVP